MNDEYGEKLRERLKERREFTAECVKTTPGAIALGATVSIPGAGEMFATDYRLRLPANDPVRMQAEVNGELNIAPERDMAAMEAAHTVGLKAARRALTF